MWWLTPVLPLRYSQTGKRLMAKCRLLHQENEDLGKVVASGKLAKLETDLALQRNLVEELKKSQSGERQGAAPAGGRWDGRASYALFIL